MFKAMKQFERMNMLFSFINDKIEKHDMMITCLQREQTIGPVEGRKNRHGSVPLGE